jgi:hypothetical protein
MAAKPDITQQRLLPWDEYRQRPPDEALASIYGRVGDASRQMCAWYWRSIRTKRWTSLIARGVAFGLLAVGTVLPLAAALQDKVELRLVFTQSAVALLVLAGLTLMADRVFGWSSGWMRYITTVMTMENLTRAFELAWGRYVVALDAPPAAADVKLLFDLAKGLEAELLKLQADETTQWVVEFNSGLALLESAVKSQREEVDRQLATIRTQLAERSVVARAEEQARQPGALEVTLRHAGAPQPVLLALDDEAEAPFTGRAWSRLAVPAGLHRVRVRSTAPGGATAERVAEVAAGAVTRLEIDLG